MTTLPCIISSIIILAGCTIIGTLATIRASHQIVFGAALDWLQFRAALQQQEIDIEREQSKLELAQEYGQLRLHQQRKQLQVAK